MIEASDEGLTARAYALADRGELAVAVRSLLDAGLVDVAVAVLDEHVLRLSARADYDEVYRATDLLPPARRTPLIQVAHADAMRHAVGISRARIEQLIARLESADRPDLLAWARCVLCELLLLTGDQTGISLAARFLAELPAQRHASSLVLQSRGRLRRIVALTYISMGADGAEPARAELDRAMAELIRAGWRSEAWLTPPVYHLYSAAVTWTIPPSVVNALHEARDQLLAMDSTQVSFARYVVLHAAWHLGDRATVQAELAELEKLGLTGEAEALTIIGRHLDAIAEAVLGDRPQALQRLGNVSDLRRVFPSMMSTVVLRATQAMLDLGRASEAQIWWDRISAAPPVLPHEELEREIIACRLALQAGEGDVADRLRAALDGVEERGHPRVAANLTLRAAMDARRAGRVELAQELRRRADRVLPPTVERTAWEQYWTGAGPATKPAADAAETGPAPTRARSLRLLAPSLEVVVDGEPRRLAPNVARLLVLLAVLGRAVSTEELTDLLWGEVEPALARGRLKSALHRLRQSLSLAPDELVVREGDVIRLLADPRWSVDLHDFYRLAGGDDRDRAEAYRRFGGLLCNAQFPYDDALAMERAVLETRWHTLAGDLVAAGTLDAAEVRRQAARIGVSLPAE
jgi:tetratricopeptide (TPR) repeat protein